MGIPKLASRLHSYASTVVFEQSGGGGDLETHQRAVIDGPALAYHIYNLCRSSKEHGVRNALQALPTYKELGIAAIRWLETIEEYNFDMYVSIHVMQGLEIDELRTAQRFFLTESFRTTKKMFAYLVCKAL
jgi:hypothetical protein